MKKVYYITLIFVGLKALMGLAYIHGLLELMQLRFNSLKDHFDLFEFFRLVDRFLLIIISLMLVVGLIIQLIGKNREFHKVLKIPILYYAAHFLIVNLPSNILNNAEGFMVGADAFEKARYLLNTFSIVGLVIFYGIFCHLHFKTNTHTEAKDVSAQLKIRFLNYLIDTVMIAQLAYWLNTYLYWSNMGYLLVFLLTTFGYYLCLEVLFRQTLGKVFTNSFVSSKTYPYAVAIVLRTFCRQIPFEPFSFLGNGKWHDTLSQTKLMRIKPQMPKRNLQDLRKELL